ncbi:ATP-dependent Clp protease proteolytic subunit [Streptomyces pratensis]|uniref:ATP-dependent Clp protease proteolytic subunit n=1 Tax=Streptomyces pratensis TaxID=1169025 RepID=UPI00301682B4
MIRPAARHVLPEFTEHTSTGARTWDRHTGRSTERITADIERATLLDAPASRAFGLVDHVLESRSPSRPPHGAG